VCACRRCGNICTPTAYSRRERLSRRPKNGVAQADSGTASHRFRRLQCVTVSIRRPQAGRTFPACGHTRSNSVWRRVRRAYKPECHSRNRHPLRSPSVQLRCRTRTATLKTACPPSNQCPSGSQNGLNASNCFCGSCYGCTSVWRFAMRPGRPCSGIRTLCFCSFQRLPTLRLMERFAALFRGWAF
jgi:hypothetical protein